MKKLCFILLLFIGLSTYAQTDFKSLELPSVQKIEIQKVNPFEVPVFQSLSYQYYQPVIDLSSQIPNYNYQQYVPIVIIDKSDINFLTARNNYLLNNNPYTVKMPQYGSVQKINSNFWIFNY